MKNNEQYTTCMLINFQLEYFNANQIYGFNSTYKDNWSSERLN